MHAVNIGICSNDYLIVTQRVETILYVKGRLQQVEFFVFIDHFLCKPEAVEGLSTQREYGLGVHIAALCDASAGRIALGYEDTALLLAVALRVTEVHDSREVSYYRFTSWLARERASLRQPSLCVRAQSP